MSEPFNPRAFVALVLTLSLVGLPLTGTANHLHQFDPLTPARHAWMAAHNVLAALFAASALAHAWLNRRALARHVGRLRREVWSAALVTAALLTLAVGHALVLR